MLFCPMNGMDPCRIYDCAWCMHLEIDGKCAPVCAIPVLASSGHMASMAATSLPESTDLVMYPLDSGVVEVANRVKDWEGDRLGRGLAAISFACSPISGCDDA